MWCRWRNRATTLPSAQTQPLVTELNCYDLAPFTPGVACDLSHIETAGKVKGFAGQESLKEALNNADVVVIPAGVPRKPGMTRDDLFGSNANVVKTIFECASTACPDAIFCIITNPVNSCVPIACEVMKKANKLNPRRVFGVSTLDIVRANTFVGEMCGVNPKEMNVPVIGGHSGITIVPLFSRATPKVSIPKDKLDALTKRVQEAGTEVVNAKVGHGSATLSMAYAGARFANSVLRGLCGERDVIECAFVMSDVTEVEYLSTPLKLGKCGVEENCGVGVVKAKVGHGSATLSMAYAGARFANSVMRGLKGESNVIECCYVQSDVTEAAYFANPVVLGKGGLEKNLGFGDINDYEKDLVSKALPELKKEIAKGVDWVKSQ
nr:unnamed protein product [Callosobruchus chinensis]